MVCWLLIKPDLRRSRFRINGCYGVYSGDAAYHQDTPNLIPHHKIQVKAGCPVVWLRVLQDEAELFEKTIRYLRRFALDLDNVGTR